MIFNFTTSETYNTVLFTYKVHIFWEGHKILRNLHLTFDYSTYRWRFHKILWPSQNIWTLLLLAHQKPIIRQTFLLGLMYIAIKQIAKLWTRFAITRERCLRQNQLPWISLAYWMMNREVINPWKKPYIRFISELIIYSRVLLALNVFYSGELWQLKNVAEEYFPTLTLLRM